MVIRHSKGIGASFFLVCVDSKGIEVIFFRHSKGAGASYFLAARALGQVIFLKTKATLLSKGVGASSCLNSKGIELGTSFFHAQQGCRGKLHSKGVGASYFKFSTAKQPGQVILSQQGHRHKLFLHREGGGALFFCE